MSLTREQLTEVLRWKGRLDKELLLAQRKGHTEKVSELKKQLNIIANVIRKFK